MMTDDIIKQVILGAPNFIVALVTIYWCFRSLDKQNEHQRALIDKMLELASINKATAELLAAQTEEQQPPVSRT
jgi:hypothetical protein